MLTVTIISLLILPLLIIYNYYRSRQWGWIHSFGVGYKNALQFKRDMSRIYPNLATVIRKDPQMYLETLAISLKSTEHLLPEQRLRFMKKQALILTKLGRVDTPMRLSDLLIELDNYEDHINADDRLAYDTLYTAIATLDVHSDNNGSEYTFTINKMAIMLSIYWLSTLFLGPPNIVIHKGTVEQDMATWCSIG